MGDSEITCVILAGGQGKRLRSADRHKACFPVAGVPTIVRAVSTFKSAGVKRFLIVVGTMAEQVIATLAAEHPDTAFVYQAEPRGTGHAAACAVEVLKASGYRGDVLVTMGDKLIQPYVVADLLARHAEAGADVTLTALPKTPTSTGGRVVTDRRGNVLGIVELPDIRRAAETRRKIRVGPRAMTAAQVERGSRSWNASLYLFKAAVLYEAVGALSDDNAQGELYLTDTVAHVVERGGRVAVLNLARREDLMAYNTPEELLEAREVFRRRLTRRKRITAGAMRLSTQAFRPAGQWLKIVEQDPPALRRALRKIYGPDQAVLAQRRRAMAAVLKLFVRHHGPRRPVVLARAPGRINLMGRHVDHRGGHVNVMAISREVVLVAGPRDDDAVTLANVDRRRFPRRDFRIGELLRAADWTDWMDYINSTTARQVLEAYRGDWSSYAKAAVLRLQHACADRRLRGMDCAVAGDIPMGAGLSSSSAVVVAVAEAAVALNALAVTTRQFVDLCGEGEWFVGSRATAAEHAAIRSGERGRVARVAFFPFHIERTVPFPDELALVVADSGRKAADSAAARDTFDQRLATYEIAERLLRKRSAILRSMAHLRDVSCEALGVSPAEIYRAVKRLPVSVSRREAVRLLGAEGAQLEETFAAHRPAGPHRLRDVAVYGIAECRRSAMFAGLLAGGRLAAVGELMRFSHDGDRVLRHADGRAVRHAPSYGDAALDRLIRRAAGEDAAGQRSAALWAQPGRYACSTAEIDHMVDIASAQPGVVGAQLAGAGLGGCAMILARSDSLAPLLRALRREYYAPRQLSCAAHVCKPVAGSGLLTV